MCIHCSLRKQKCRLKSTTTNGWRHFGQSEQRKSFVFFPIQTQKSPDSGFFACDLWLYYALLPPPSAPTYFLLLRSESRFTRGEEWSWQKPISTNFKIGPLQLRSVSENVPKWSFLCLSRSPIWYGFRVCSRVIRYFVKMALAFITKSLTFTKRAVHVTFDPRTYTQIHAPTVVQGGVNGALPEFFVCCSISKRFYL